MKVLLTTHVFLPEFSGGTEVLVHGVAIALMRRGHSVLVVTGYPRIPDLASGDCFDEYEVESIPVVRYRRDRILPGREDNPMRLSYLNRSFESGFQRVLARFAPDVVHFHHLEGVSVTAVDACSERRIPALLTVTDYWCICPTHTLFLDGRICDGPVHDAANCLQHIASVTPVVSWATRALGRVPTPAVGVGMAMLKRTGTRSSGQLGYAQALAQRGGAFAARLALMEKIIVPTRFTQHVLEKSGVRAGRFRVLPYGLRDGGYLRRVRNRGGGDLVVGFIGSLQEHKGLHVLVDAVRRLPETSRVRLRIYGKPPVGGESYAREVRAAASADARIEFRDTFDNAQIATVLDQLDLLVIPSIWHENMPLVSLSAQAAACPLVASDIGGLADVVAHGRNGLLFRPGSSSELADLLTRVVNEEGLLSTLSSQAVHPLDMEQYVDELDREYRHACREMD